MKNNVDANDNSKEISGIYAFKLLLSIGFTISDGKLSSYEDWERHAIKKWKMK